MFLELPQDLKNCTLTISTDNGTLVVKDTALTTFRFEVKGLPKTKEICLSMNYILNGLSDGS